MIRNLLFFAALCGLVACQDVPSDRIVIEGYIDQVPDSVVVRFFRSNGDYGEPIGADTLRDGRFSMTITPLSDEPELFYVGCPDHPNFPKATLHVWASPGERVRIRGNNTLTRTWRVKGKHPALRAEQRYIDVARDLWGECDRINIEQRRVRSLAKTATTEERKVLAAMRDSLAEYEFRVKHRIDGLVIELMQRSDVDDKYLEELEGLARMVRYEGENYPHREAVLALYDRLSEEQRRLPLARAAAMGLFPPKQVAVGEPLIDGVMFDLAGENHSLSELKGRYILLDFWSNGCGPCVMAIPEMGEIAAQYADCLAVVSISIDTDKTWREASQEHPMTWLNWNDGRGEQGIYAHYYQGGIPSYTLLSPEGVVVKQWVGYGKGSLKRTIREVLGE